MNVPPRSSGSIRRELVVSTAVLFVSAVVVAMIAGALALPVLGSPLQAALVIALIVAADLAVLFVFLRRILRRAVFDPLERIGTDAELIAAGRYDHSIAAAQGEELDRLVRSLNTMAERLISDQTKLAENVRSLDRTNQELVAATEELVRGARMASVGTLAAGLAHEVGNPLGALIGTLDVAIRRVERGGDVAGPLASSLEEARRIDRIVRSILDFAHPGGRNQGEPKGGEGRHPVVSVTESVDRAIELLEGRGALEAVTLRWSVGSAPSLVRARPQHLEQVVMNLLMNALWAVRDGQAPELIVRVTPAPPLSRDPVIRRASDPPGVDYSHRRRIPLLLSEGTARSAMDFIPGDAGATGGGNGSRSAVVVPDVILEVEDNGPGLPEDRVAHVFDPFFTTKQPGEGTGFGLAITLRIVQELGGKIHASNREEGGARFTVRLPGASPEALSGSEVRRVSEPYEVDEGVAPKSRESERARDR